MKVHPFIFIPTLLITIHTVSHCEPEPLPRKNLILNEIKISPGGEGKFLELKADQPDISLDDYYIGILDYSRNRQENNRETLRVKGILSLKGKRLSGKIGFIGKNFAY